MIGKSINNVVKEFIDEERGETLHNFRRYRGFAINGYRELHMDHSGAPSYKIIELDDSKNWVDLPEDCIVPILIGNINSANNIVPMTLKQDMLLNDDDSEGFRSWVFGGYGVNTQYFDIKSYVGSSYQRDVKNNRLKISSNRINGCIYLEYLADIEKVNGDYNVPIYECEAVKAYIRWANVRSNIRLPKNVRDDFMELFYIEKEKVGSRVTAQTPDQFISEVRKTYTSVPRM